MVTRRQFLSGVGVASITVAARGGLAAADLLGPFSPFPQQPADGPSTITLSGAIGSQGSTLYLPFTVPKGVNRLTATLNVGGNSKVGFALFDYRGSSYQSPGYRGMYLDDRKTFIVESDAASPSFVPGVLEPGRYVVAIPVFRATDLSQVTVTIDFGYGPHKPGFVPESSLATVIDHAGWYRGDLNAHTFNSVPGALNGPAWVVEARRVGLDFVALTDDNTIVQNLHLETDRRGHDVLLIPGQQIVSPNYGHSSVVGAPVGTWFDYRQAPMGSGSANYSAWSRLVRDARASGGFFSAVHPMDPNAPWAFALDALNNPKPNLPHAFQVWTAAFQTDDRLALGLWDTFLRQGYKVWATGGSDRRLVKGATGTKSGLPTTVVYAEALSVAAVVDGLKNGRHFISRSPDGVEAYITATGPAFQHQISGGTLYGAASDTATVLVRVRRGSGTTLVVTGANGPLQITPVTSGDQTVSVTVPFSATNFVRAEVQGTPQVITSQPTASALGTEAITNPIFLSTAKMPKNYENSYAPVPAKPGSRRKGPTPS